MKPTRTWILIADGSRAMVFESLGVRSELTAVDDMSISQDLPPSRELRSDRPGRSQESANPTRHAIESRSDPHRELKRHLAREVAERLEICARDGRFDRLAVVAAPVVLGDMREAFSDNLRSMITAELAKDLVHVPMPDLPAHLEAVR
jgi:protein required for attachment to host cells